MRLPPLTDGQLEQFQRDGFVVFGRILDDDDRDALLAAEARHRPDPFPGFEGSGSGLLLSEQLCHHSTAVRSFCIGGAHIPLLGQLLGPEVAFTHTQFITKLPDPPAVANGAGATSIPLHQDDGYGTLDPPDDVTVWTALTDTDEQNGCLVVVPGSHTQGIVEHQGVDDNPALREARADGAVALPLAAGEAVAFSGLLLHGSGANRSTEVRVGMHARYCHPLVRMVAHGGRPVLRDAHSWMVLGEAPLSDEPPAPG